MCFNVFTRASLYVLKSVFVFSVFPLCCCLVASTNAINCLERFVSEMTYYIIISIIIKSERHHNVCQVER